MGAGKSREIKDRIKGVKSTHQITNAMNIVSSTKFKRFSALVEKSRPYAESLHGVLKNIAAGLKSEKHPLLDGKKTVKKIGVVYPYFFEIFRFIAELLFSILSVITICFGLMPFSFTR